MSIYRLLQTLLIAAASSVLIVGCQSQAEESVPTRLELQVGNITSLNLTISDEVSGGCFTNISSVERTIALEMARSDIDEDEASRSILKFSAFGYRTDGGTCVVSYRFEIIDCGYFRPSFQNEGVFGCVIILGWPGLVSGSKEQVESNLVNSVGEFSRDLMYHIEMDRRKKRQ